MGIKYIHLILVIVSIALCLDFGVWTLNHNYTTWAVCSFVVTLGLIIYCVKFIKKMKGL
jgi:hypothetical protein